VRGFERFGDLPGDAQRLIERQRSGADAIRQCEPLDQFHHQRANAAGVFEAVDRRDVGMIERRQYLRLALEAHDVLRVGGQGGRQHFQCDLPAQLGVGRPIHLAHTARAEGRSDFVRSEASPGGQSHRCRSILPYRWRRKNLLCVPAEAVFGSAGNSMGGNYAKVTSSACRPFGPFFTMNDTRAPSSSDR